MNIVVAHPVDLMREGICTSCASWGEPAFDVVKTCESFSSLKMAIRDEKVDVIVLDGELEPDVDSLSLLRELQNISEARLVLLGSWADGFFIQTVFKLGVAAYLYRYDVLSVCLSEALYAVMNEREYLSPTATSEYLSATQSSRPEMKLDVMDIQVLRLISRGHRPKEVALALELKTRKVYAVLEDLRRVFGVASTPELIMKAISLNLI